VQVEVVPARELTPDQRRTWSMLQGSAPELTSPYFCPEFTTAVASIRNNVRVALLHQGGRVLGFFPFQRSMLGTGFPVGGPLSDFHGLICEPGFGPEASVILRKCRLNSWAFTHLVSWQTTFSAYYSEQAESHYIDLTDGFAGYSEALRGSGSRLLKDVRTKRRKLEKLGEVRFVPHEADPALLELLLAWKSEQYRGSGLVDVFGFAWAVELLRVIHSTQRPDFAGMLSVLYVGDEPAAIHMGMRSRDAWNWWFPRHQERFAKYSPGILLRVAAAEYAPTLGIRRIDLGTGGESTYKPRLASGHFLLARGRAERPSLLNGARHVTRSVETLVRQSRLYRVARVPGRYIKQLERHMRFR
jgi:CelD/BcsL family acetyltransferase involved in cellulose biosynthesis